MWTMSLESHTYNDILVNRKQKLPQQYDSRIEQTDNIVKSLWMNYTWMLQQLQHTSDNQAK